MLSDNNDRVQVIDDPADDEGGLRAPPDLKGWKKAWWWFHFLILVKLARLRFIGILLLIGIVLTQWDTLLAYYERWTRPASPEATAASNVEYFCPMHPSVIRDNPRDKCPICFMPLSKRKKGSAEVEALPAGVVNRVQLSPYRVVLAGVQTLPIDYQLLSREISAVGYVEFDERGQRTVSARVKGRIEKLFANQTGEFVRQGDELASLYSPELVVTVDNLLEAKRANNSNLVQIARTRLERWGIDDKQISEILAAGRSETQIKIRSPISGHVITKYVREGQYVDEGMPLYDLADLSTVWIQAQVYEDDLALLPALGMEGLAREPIEMTATIRSLPGQEFHGKLSFVYPHADEATRTVTVRFALENPDHALRPGNTATVTIKIDPKHLPSLTKLRAEGRTDVLSDDGILAVPETAVIDTGRQKIVYRESSPGVFEGVEVHLGPRMSAPDGAFFYPVLSGLAKGEMVVGSGSFLVDAETRLNPAAGSIYFGGGGKSATPSVTAVRPSTPEDPDAQIAASFAALSDEDRKLAEAQRFCPVLPDSKLGSMGPPVKLMIKGTPMFVCCKGCQKQALSKPDETLAKVKQLINVHNADHP